MGTDDLLPEALQVTLELVHVLDRLGIPYVVAGSVASSIHGMPRSTQDVDIAAALGPSRSTGSSTPSATPGTRTAT